MASKFIRAERNTEDSLNYSDPNRWNNAAADYNAAVGESSKLAATRLITLTNDLHPISAASDPRALDLGAGTGSLTHLLSDAFPSLPILATDISPGMLEKLMATGALANKKNVTTQVADMSSPVGGEVTEGSFSHVFSTMAIQVLPNPADEGTLGKWASLLQPDGVVAIAVWDFNEVCGPHSIWTEAAKAVDPFYESPPPLPPRHWYGHTQVEEELKKVGFRDVMSEVLDIGFNVGKEGFMRFFWESENPMPIERLASFKGDLSKVKLEMDRLLDEKYDSGKKIPLFAALAVGKRPAQTLDFWGDENLYEELYKFVHI
ncbi:S-adenosyl-L-methionine-dependent methyltransferase [Glarea lozoyensis ATCC 20868]|uniref:S-adenosyl-L-methionine-dependent methyltransferase n=1 Tax=Glarea lozoyensis (strain ATCC 20868 / MF5171) TaxID=1116229 RepID=S3CZY0_GLAL2|nr:S-adenosyl-L-methionine-dependent methyltransferase [Glarea lozoyensis ATCC 20868]EPE31807.1 S-adenosyl-L-methionine-dependent methyltransferase [Glarea lozoyensis ATCC 20868]